MLEKDVFCFKDSCCGCPPIHTFPTGLVPVQAVPCSNTSLRVAWEWEHYCFFQPHPLSVLVCCLLPFRRRCCASRRYTRASSRMSWVGRSASPSRRASATMKVSSPTASPRMSEYHQCPLLALGVIPGA